MITEKQTELTWQDMERLTNDYELNLDTIKVTDRFKSKTPDSIYLFYGETHANMAETDCPVCGSWKSLVKYGFQPERVEYTDVPIDRCRTFLLLKVQRYKCSSCGATFSEDISKEFSSSHQVTRRAYHDIASNAFDYPFISVARRFGVDPKTVAEIFDENSSEYEAKNRTVVAPVSLGIDEKHIEDVMRGVFVDNHKGILLEMTPDRSESSVKNALKSMAHPENIKYVTMDMHAPYRSWVREILPDAKIIVDRYHITQKLYACVSEAKEQIIKAINKQLAKETDPVRLQVRTRIKNAATDDPKLFKYGIDKLDKYPAKKRLLTEACAEFPELNHLRLIKEGIQRIYPPKEMDVLSNRRPRSEAEKMYEAWCDLIPPTGSKNIAQWEAKYKVPAKFYTSFRGFQDTISHWYNEVFSYFETECGETNAVAEGVNNLIGIITRDGSGYSFKRLRVKSLYRSLAEGPRNYSFSKELRKNRYEFEFSMNKMHGFNPSFVVQDSYSESDYVYKLVYTAPYSKRPPLSVLWYTDKNQHNPDSLLEYL